MFETDTDILLINKNKNESNHFYYLKCLYLSNVKLKKSNYDYYINLANCYANYKINGCVYNDHIMKEIIV